MNSQTNNTFEGDSRQLLSTMDNYRQIVSVMKEIADQAKLAWEMIRDKEYATCQKN